MIPLVDDFLQMYIVKRLKWIKEHPAILDHIFYTGKRETLEKLREFITSRKVKVIIGYPKDQTSLPAYVITLAPESEQPIGLGDNSDTYEELEFEEYDEDTPEYIQGVEHNLARFLAATYMNATYRIECWSDNGDLTAFMYVILKWCLWSSRQDMLNLGWVNIRLSGSDLEPVPDYMPVFIYRRAAQIELTYENLYYEHVEQIEDYIDILDNPDKYKEDEDGNIIDDSGDVVLPTEIWQIIAHYYQEVVNPSSHFNYIE